MSWNKQCFVGWAVVALAICLLVWCAGYNFNTRGLEAFVLCALELMWLLVGLTVWADGKD